MFRHRQRRPAPFSDFIDWTDYRWDPTPWQGVVNGPPWAGHPRHQRGYTFFQVFFAGLAVVVGVKLMSSLRNRRNRSWLERAVLAILLLMVTSYMSRRRRPL